MDARRRGCGLKAVRLPLSIGADTVAYGGGGAAMLGAGLLALAVGLGSLSQGGWLWALGGLVLLVAGGAVAWVAWAMRASDVVLDAEGFAVEGGARGGRRIAWGELAAVSEGPGETHAYELGITAITKRGERVLLAEVDAEEERESLRALAATLRAALRLDAPPPPTSADVARCGHCGVGLSPSAEASVRCAACGSQQAMPPALRERVAGMRAAEQARAATGEAVRGLLEQPGVARARAAILAASAVSLVGWAAVYVAAGLIGFGVIGGFEIGGALFSGWALVFAAFALARVSIARRRAVLVICTSFGARPPARAGEAPGCRQCGAPLPATQGVLARCAYCGTESVLGLAVTPVRERAQAHQEAIDEVLAKQASERSRWRWIGASGLLAAALGGFWLVVQVAMAFEYRALVEACDDRDERACFDLGWEHRLGTAVPRDDRLALRYFERACKLEHAEACHDAAEHHAAGWGTDEDDERAAELRARACELGFDEACGEAE